MTLKLTQNVHLYNCNIDVYIDIYVYAVLSYSSVPKRHYEVRIVLNKTNGHGCVAEKRDYEPKHRTVTLFHEHFKHFVNLDIEMQQRIIFLKL